PFGAFEPCEAQDRSTSVGPLTMAPKFHGPVAMVGPPVPTGPPPPEGGLPVTPVACISRKVPDGGGPNSPMTTDIASYSSELRPTCCPMYLLTAEVARD